MTRSALDVRSLDSAVSGDLTGSIGRVWGFVLVTLEFAPVFDSAGRLDGWNI